MCIENFTRKDYSPNFVQNIKKRTDDRECFEFKDKMNLFEKNRKRQLEQLILQDSEVKQFMVNAERPTTFGILTKREKRRVLWWKDLKRLLYVVVRRKIGSALPPASHIKKEQLINERVPEVLQDGVIVSKVCKNGLHSI